MNFDYNIALILPMYEQDSRLLGHLWHRPKKDSMTRHWGQQYPELDETLREQAVRHVIGTHRFSASSKLDKQRSLNILSGILRAFGAGEVNISSLTKKSFSLEVDLTDYVRLQVPRAVLSRMHGLPLPLESVKGGHWFASYAQHQALRGTLNLKYSSSKTFDLAAKLDEVNRHSLVLKRNTEKEQLFSFEAGQPLVFGVSLQHFWENDGGIGKFGSEHRGIRYVGI